MPLPFLCTWQVANGNAMASNELEEDEAGLEERVIRYAACFSQV